MFYNIQQTNLITITVKIINLKNNDCIFFKVSKNSFFLMNFLHKYKTLFKLKLIHILFSAKLNEFHETKIFFK